MKTIEKLLLIVIQIFMDSQCDSLNRPIFLQVYKKIMINQMKIFNYVIYCVLQIIHNDILVATKLLFQIFLLII